MVNIPIHVVPSRPRAPSPAPDTARAGQCRWQAQDVAALFNQPLPDLLFQAQQVHRAHHDATQIQLSTLLSIKTGGCPEDCGYCSQSVHADAGVVATKLMPLDEVLQAAGAAKARGATRFCMGAAPIHAT